MRLFVTERADLLRDLERELSPRTDKIIDTIIQLYLFPENADAKKWKFEIARNLNSVSVIKKKLPTAKQLYKWTYYKKWDLVTDIAWMSVTIRDIEYKCHAKVTEPVETVCKDVDDICCKYFHWLTHELSTYGCVVNAQIDEKLDELLRDKGRFNNM